MSKRKPGKVRPYLEYLMLRAFQAVVQLLPQKFAYALGRCAGGTFAGVLFRRKVVMENLQLAYGNEKSPAEIRQLARATFRNLAQTLMEMMWLRGRLTEERLAELTTLEGGDVVREALSRGRGLLIVTAHLGNWELAGHVLSREFGPVHSVARPLKNKYVNRYLDHLRNECGQNIIERGGALKEIVKVLRQNGIVVLLIDQHARRDSLPVDFFGQQAWTVTAPAAFALRMGCPIVTGYSYRDPDGLHHHMVIDELIDLESTGDKDADVRQATQLLTGRIEAFVRKHPEQWLWVHRRWKLGSLSLIQKEENLERSA